MKRTFSITLLMLAMAAVLKAAPISRQQARQQAEQFLAQKGLSQQLSPVSDRAKLPPRQGQPGTADADAYYVFNRTSGGFIIVSADDQTLPVLGYSDQGSFCYSEMPDNMKSLLAEYERQISHLRQHNTVAAPAAVPTHPAIPKLMTCTWNQGNPYNQNCPNYFGQGTSVTGCVATAMAQIMYYQRDKSTDRTLAAIPAYTAPTEHPVYGHLKVDGIPEGSPIDWANMRDNYNGSESFAQREAVANLMLYCGVSVQMDYTNSASGAYSYRVADALKAYFGYGSSVQYVQQGNYSNEAWDELCYNELANGRAFYLSGANSEAGHAFVCDGYDGDRHYHINWGWGGQSDGFYLLTNLSPGSQGIGGSSDGYNSGVEAIIGMEPDNFADMALNISDSRARLLCISNWDANGDGKLSYGEAAAVEDLGTVFKGQSVKTFRELRNFTALKRIADDAFNGCSSLTAITLPQGITQIGDRAFSGCRSLTALTLPAALTGIGEEAFSGCRVLSNVSLPAGLTAIAPGTFEGCAAITALDLPSGIASLGSSALAGCSKLTSLKVHASQPDAIALGTDVFSGLNFADAVLSVEQGGKTRFAQADQWSQFLNIKEFRVRPEVSFSALVSDRKVYIYNVGMGRYLTRGEAWGSQAIVGEEPMTFVLKHDASMPEGTYYLYSDETGSTRKVLFRTSRDSQIGVGVKACFVDGYSDETSYWNIAPLDNGYYTFQPPKSSADYASGCFLGVLTSHASKAAKPTYGAYYDISYNAHEENCQWAFVDCEAVYGLYDEAARLEELLLLAKQRNLETAVEEAVLDNMESTIDDLKNAQRKLRRKLGFIDFADERVREVCVANWDLDGNGEISTTEASMVTTLNYVFYTSELTSFDELKYFTNLATLDYYAFGQCRNLQEITVPELVTHVYSYAFTGDVSLKSVELPQYVELIDDSAFEDCKALETFSIANPDPSSISLGNDVFKGVDLQKATLYVPQGSKELYAAADVWKQFGTIKEMRTQVQPSFSEINEGQHVYIYNLATRKFVSRGEAYGTQAVVSPSPMVYALYQTSTPDVYTLEALQLSGNHYLFRTDTDSKVGEGVKACFVDGALSNRAYWHVNHLGDNVFTIQVPANDASYVEGQFLGIQSSHPSNAASPTMGLYYDVPYQGNEANCQWAFVNMWEVENAKQDLERVHYLKKLLQIAAKRNIDAASEQAVYDDMLSTNEDIEDAIASLREKLHFIAFLSEGAKTVCVNNWDDDGDGELSLEEAAAVKTIGTAFRKASFESFSELQYFTSISEIPDQAFANCTSMMSIYIPANVKSIGRNAFTGCNNLKYAAVFNPEPQHLEAASSSLQRSLTVFVPKDCLEAYQADDYWSRFSYKEFTGEPTVRLESQQREYGRSNSAFKFAVEGAPINSKPEIFSEADLTSPVGTYPIDAFVDAAMTPGVVVIPAEFVVTPVTITVTAKSCTRRYGEPNPEFELTYRTFRNREKAEDVLTKQPVVECDATETSPAGDYEIRVSGAEAQNYVFEYVSGVLTVENDPNAITLPGTDAAREAVYDLQGRKIDNRQSVNRKLPKGIYIRNGRKVVVK